MISIFFFLSLLGSVFAAHNIDLNNLKAVQEAAKGIANQLIAHHNKGLDNPNRENGPTGFQWYEGGLMWGAVMEYVKTVQDTTYANIAVNALTKESWGTLGDFLGNNKEASSAGGKWNDDMAWWSIPVLTGLDMYGKDAAMPGGVKYLTLATNSYQDILSTEWDDVCGGGFYWIRSAVRTGKNSNGQSLAYKSTITSIEMLYHSARLGKVTGDSKYFEEADKIYRFLLKSGLITPSNEVIDGIGKEDGVCKIAIKKDSYISGMTSGSLAALSYFTKKQEYLDKAHQVFATGQKSFTQNSVIFDECEVNTSCAANTAQPKGTLIRGWGHLHEFTTSKSIKGQIKLLLQATMQRMLQSCDGNWNCGSDWLNPKVPTLYSIHSQINALELVTAYTKTFYDGPVGKGMSAPNQSVDLDDTPPPFNSALGLERMTLHWLLLVSIVLQVLL